MDHQNELLFLCDVLKKNRLQAVTLSFEDLQNTPVLQANEFGEASAPQREHRLHQLLAKAESKTLYKLSDSLLRHYLFLLLPSPSPTPLLLIGPYLTSAISEEDLLLLAEQHHLSPKSRTYLAEYYLGLPILSESSPLFTMIDSFCERAWNTTSFSVVEVEKEHLLSGALFNEPSGGERFSDILVNMKTMEQRYHFENELIRAVSLGQIHKEKQLLAAFSASPFEKRVADPLRNSKNYCIIMNTLLRKAAESGGVHPVYLDRVSTQFAFKIEQMFSVSECPALMREMFCTYCRLVRKHTMRQFSPVVQKAMLIIDSDLTADLTLHTLAESQSLSDGYLSTIFKKETGKTVSEYIREKRISHAAHLLATTQLQIQTVALHCGILDVQYFSKIFKKQMGLSPKDYRATTKQS